MHFIVLHTLNIRLSNKELEYIINHAEDKIMFVDETLLPKFEQIDEKTLNKLSKIIICGNNQAAGKWKSKLKNAIDFEEFIATGDETYDWPELDEKSGAALLYFWNNGQSKGRIV